MKSLTLLLGCVFLLAACSKGDADRAAAALDFDSQSAPADWQKYDPDWFWKELATFAKNPHSIDSRSGFACRSYGDKECHWSPYKMAPYTFTYLPSKRGALSASCLSCFSGSGDCAKLRGGPVKVGEYKSGGFASTLCRLTEEPYAGLYVSFSEGVDAFFVGSKAAFMGIEKKRDALLK